MEKTAKIYVAGHHGLVGSAIWNNLQQKGYTNLVGTCGRHHGEQSLPCRFYLSELADSAECDRGEFPP